MPHALELFGIQQAQTPALYLRSPYSDNTVEIEVKTGKKYPSAKEN